MNLKDWIKLQAKKLINTGCYFSLLPAKLGVKKTIVDNKVNKVLLINLQGIGDVIMTTPFLSALKKKYPNAQVDYLVYKFNGALIQEDSRITNLIKRNEANILSKDFLNTLKTIRKEKYDIIINLFPAQHGQLLTLLSNAEYKLGNLYSTKATTNNVAVQDGQATWDVRQNAAYIAQQLGLAKYDQAKLSLEVKEKDKKEIDKYTKKPFIAINPNASWQAKIGQQNIGLLFLKKIKNDKAYNKYNILLIGGPGDKEIAQKVIDSTQTGTNLAGALSLQETAALLSKAQILISADTGPLHMAIAVQTKTIGLYGVTDPDILIKGAPNSTIISTYNECPKKWRFNHNNEPPKEGQAMMEKITPQQVKQALDNALKKK